MIVSCSTLKELLAAVSEMIEAIGEDAPIERPYGSDDSVTLELVCINQKTLAVVGLKPGEINAVRVC